MVGSSELSSDVGEEAFVDVVAAVGADEAAAAVVEPGERALDNPAVAAEPGAVFGLGSGR